MKTSSILYPVVALATALVTMTPAVAQQHRATRLGNPETRFADPLSTPEDLRRLFRNERLRDDIISILRQSNWQGDLEDFWEAAATARITETRIMPGARLQAMSSRENGRPILLRDVLWAGREPEEAYIFLLVSKGRQYRVITPKACANFWIEDIGADPTPPPQPALELVKVLPPESTLCDPIPCTLTVRNSGNVTLTQIRVIDTPGVGFKHADGEDRLQHEIESLAPGQSREFKLELRASMVGHLTNSSVVTCLQNASAQAVATTWVRSPVLRLSCVAPTEVYAGRPLNVCLTVSNQGDTGERRTTVKLPIPTGVTLRSATDNGQILNGEVVWEIPDLAPGASRELCAVFVSSEPDRLVWNAVAQGACAQGTRSECASVVGGIPALLLEVVDLNDPIEVGKEQTYEITVLNQGSAEDTGIRLRFFLEESQEFVSGAGSTPVQAEGRTITTEPLAVLAPKDTATWRIVVRALAAGDLRFSTELTSDQLQRPVKETEATRQY